ncbi:hypothetical protein JCM9279_006202 [Rhodotorula babjevae]
MCAEADSTPDILALADSTADLEREETDEESISSAETDQEETSKRVLTREESVDLIKRTARIFVETDIRDRDFDADEYTDLLTVEMVEVDKGFTREVIADWVQDYLVDGDFMVNQIKVLTGPATQKSIDELERLKRLTEKLAASIRRQKLAIGVLKRLRESGYASCHSQVAAAWKLVR